MDVHSSDINPNAKPLNTAKPEDFCMSACLLSASSRHWHTLFYETAYTLKSPLNICSGHVAYGDFPPDMQLENPGMYILVAQYHHDCCDAKMQISA